MDPLVSMIVPVYNAKDYITRCVDSILAQEYGNMEILLVDDGSTDGSGRILDEYAAMDDRVTVIHQANGGVSASRNLGLDRARGKYIQFADSDDWLAPEATRLMAEAAEETGADLVITDFYRVVGERKAAKGDIDADGVIDRMEFASYMIENPADFYYGVLWNKLFRRSLIEERHLRMDTEISWCEDFLFNLEYLSIAETFYAVRKPVYYYIYRRGSLVSQSASITKTIQTKIHVFEYYSAFYKGVYGDDYDAVKMKVRKFLIDAAGDGGVRPEFPGSGYGFIKKEAKSADEKTEKKHSEKPPEAKKGKDGKKRAAKSGAESASKKAEAKPAGEKAWQRRKPKQRMTGRSSRGREDRRRWTRRSRKAR